MSYADNTTEFDPGARDPDELEVEELDQAPILPIPQIATIQLDGDYACAVLSLAGDPLAPNLAEQVKVRTLLAIDVPSLQPQIISCLISDYGMGQEAAELLAEQSKPALPRLGRETRAEEHPIIEHLVEHRAEERVDPFDTKPVEHDAERDENLGWEGGEERREDEEHRPARDA